MEKELLIKMWKEIEEKFEVLRKLENKLDVKEKEEVIYWKLYEKEKNVCDIVRKNVLIWVYECIMVFLS